MLTLYSGSQLELLADRLVEQLRSDPSAEPLVPEIMVVQNHGMARWLSTQIAGKSGIAANLKFLFPGEIVWDLYRAMDPDIPEELPSDRGSMRWTLLRLLEELPGKPPFQTVWNYMREYGQWSPLKAWKLAGEIADIFDKYLNYRQEMLLEWEEGHTTGYGTTEEWQANLWRKLNAVWEKECTESRWKHQARVHRAFMEQTEKGNLSTGNLPRRISLFGLSGLQPSYIEVFSETSRHIDVHWYRTDPAVRDPNHPLVRSWGGEGVEFNNLLKKITEANDIPTNKVKIEEIESPRSVLGQRSSVTIHSCHSPLREVEVLYDRLLDHFDHDPDLTPDDILVITPDIATYAPFIDAVFGTAESGLPELPFYIVDERGGIRKEVFRTFSKLLQILDSRFKVTEVLDLLSTRTVLDRFDISEDEFDRLSRWVAETKVRWGLDGEHRRQMDLPESSNFTWRFGLDRMMLGFASRPGEEVFHGIYPFEGIESSDDAVLLGKLSRFINELKNAWSLAQKTHTPEQWAEILIGWISAFIPAGREYHRAYRGLAELAGEMGESAGRGAFREPIGYSVVLDYMSSKLDAEAGRGGYFGHGITFSGLDPMRNIPFKVIAMIGMNNEAFPRRRVAPDFDLMAGDPEPGDRDRRNDDRNLFLETIHSAEDLFYLSYVGQSDRDDSSRPPSVMISELLDHLAEERGEIPEKMVLKHPLHAYSRRYFDEEEQRLFSYSRTRYEVSGKLAAPDDEGIPFWDGPLLEADESFRQLSVGDLFRFFENPSRYLLQYRLGLYLREEEVISEEREPFELGGLDGYRLAEELLKRNLKNRDTAAFEPIARARGWLPEGWPGRQAFRDKAEEVREFGREIGHLLESPKLDPAEVSLESGDFHLTGILDSLYGEYQLFFRFGSLRAKDLIRLWINHLALQQVEGLEHTYRSLLATRDKDDAKPGYYLLPKLKNAEELLDRLLKLYWTGIHSRTPFFADSSFSYAHELFVNGKDHESALSSARRKWHDSWQPRRSEREDPYIKILFGDEEPIGEPEFINLSREFWEPVFNVLNREEESVA